MKDADLRVHHFGFQRQVVEEGTVKLIAVLQIAFSADITGMGHRGRFKPALQQFVRSEKCNGFFAVY
ncbi:hypothetical protein D3C86_2107400 [compost metagenome]